MKEYQEKTKRLSDNMRSRLFLSAVLFMILFFLTSMQARAIEIPASIKCGDNVYATLENGVLTLKGSGDTYDCEIRTTPFYEYRNLIKKIVISNGITSVGDRLFMEISAEVEFGNTVRSIGNNAFYCNEGVKEIQFPQSLRKIAYQAFFGCNRLTYAPLNRGLQYLGSEAFIYCSLGSEIIIPRGCVLEENALLKDLDLRLGKKYYTPVYEVLVTLKPNGGTLNQTGVFKYFEKPYGELPVPVRTGYTFMGWVLEGDADKTVITPNTTVTWEPTLVATWCGHPRTVLMNVQEATYLAKGYTGDTHCAVCGVKLKSGTRTPKLVLKAPYVKKVTPKPESITVNLRKPDAAATGFKIQYSTDKTFKSNVKTVTLGRDKTSVTIKNLKAGKKYYVRVRAYKALTEKTVYSQWSNILNTKPKIKAEKPVIARVIAKSRGLSLRMEKLGQDMKGYEVQYSTDKNFKKSVKKVTLDRSQRTLTITNLKARTKYYIRVRSYAVDAGKTIRSDWCKTKSVTTKK